MIFLKKYINEKNILVLLIILNVIVVAEKLMDYKTDRLIDANSELAGAMFIYKK